MVSLGMLLAMLCSGTIVSTDVDIKTFDTSRALIFVGNSAKGHALTLRLATRVQQQWSACAAAACTYGMTLNAEGVPVRQNPIRADKAQPRVGDPWPARQDSVGASSAGAAAAAHLPLVKGGVDVIHITCAGDDLGHRRADEAKSNQNLGKHLRNRYRISNMYTSADMPCAKLVLFC